MSSLKPVAGLIVRPLPGGDAVVATADGPTAVILNPTAQILLDLLDGTRSTAELVALVCSCWPTVEPGAVERDVAAVLDQLVSTGLVIECGDAASSA